jgi:tRNA-splicing ligase RtcB
MIRTIDTEKIPIKLWLREMEKGAMQQARNLANLPFAFRHIAIMPDAHEGYGMPIGGVLATEDHIVPNAVGVDIGCGMSATRTSLQGMETGTLKELLSGIRDIVPLGFKHHPKRQDEHWMPGLQMKRVELKNRMPVVAREYENALYQLGTLGGGNHFIEVQQDKDGFLWLMIHSGSRNFGKQVADYYNRLATTLNEKQGSVIPRSWQLAHLSVEGEEGRKYISEMQYCVDFAFSNRQLMMTRIQELLTGLMHGNVSFEPIINIAHNYAAEEKHFGRKVWVHRKGATQARKGQMGIIPGSQGTESFIVRGLGNPESFESCSHGAGRIMGRNEAIRSLDLNEVIRSLDRKNILHSIRSQRDLDEAPDAYKDISQVMAFQDDLVEKVVELKPLAVIKG